MQIDISQPGDLQPGYALLTVRPPPEATAEGVLFSIEQPPRGFLQAYGQVPWGSTHAWLKPVSIAANTESWGLTLAPDHTWNLKPNVTYVLRLRAPGGGAPLTTLRIAWKAIRMPSKAPQMLPNLAPMTVKQLEPEPEPIEEEPVLPPLIQKTPAPIVPTVTKTTATTAALDTAPKRKTWIWIVLALIVLAGAAAGAWFVLHRAPSAPIPPPVPAEMNYGAPTAREFLKTSPSTEAVYTEAQLYLKKASPDALQGALVLLNHAASAGNGPAATEIGRMYDPEGFDAKASAMKAPDPDKALLWYQRAAQANDPEGLYRLGKLLVSGHAEAPGQGPEQGTADLQRASQLGYQPARQELDKLHAKP